MALIQQNCAMWVRLSDVLGNGNVQGSHGGRRSTLAIHTSGCGRHTRKTEEILQDFTRVERDGNRILHRWQPDSSPMATGFFTDGNRTLHRWQPDSSPMATGFFADGNRILHRWQPDSSPMATGFFTDGNWTLHRWQPDSSPMATGFFTDGNRILHRWQPDSSPMATGLFTNFTNDVMTYHLRSHSLCPVGTCLFLTRIPATNK